MEIQISTLLFPFSRFEYYSKNKKNIIFKYSLFLSSILLLALQNFQNYAKPLRSESECRAYQHHENASKHYNKISYDALDVHLDHYEAGSVGFEVPLFGFGSLL